MRVALEAGELLEVAITEGDRIVGTLSLQLNSIGGSSKAASRSTVSSAGAAAPARKQRKTRKPMSPEARARMAAAQKARWAKARGEDVPSSDSGSGTNQ